MKKTILLLLALIISLNADTYLGVQMDKRVDRNEFKYYTNSYNSYFKQLYNFTIDSIPFDQMQLLTYNIDKVGYIQVSSKPVFNKMEVDLLKENAEELTEYFKEKYHTDYTTNTGEDVIYLAQFEPKGLKDIKYIKISVERFHLSKGKEVCYLLVRYVGKKFYDSKGEIKEI